MVVPTCSCTRRIDQIDPDELFTSVIEPVFMYSKMRAMLNKYCSIDSQSQHHLSLYLTTLYIPLFSLKACNYRGLVF